MEKLNSEIGQRIRDARSRAGLTQPALGEVLGVEKAAISKYEAGEAKRGVPIEFLIRIAKKCNVTLDWLITGDNPKPPPEPLDNGDALAIAITTRPEVLGKIKQRIREEIREELSEYQANPRDRLTDDEKNLIDNYRAADDRTKENALWILQRSAQESRTHDGGGSDCADTRSA